MSAVHRSIGNVMVLLQRPGDGRVLAVRNPSTSRHSPGHTRTELVWVGPAAPPPGCQPFTRAVLTHFATGRLYANVSAPELPGGEAG
ncbi:hypothetical protein AB0P17_37405 [Streptomyces sp. NPDC088124]|uniref:hypothetical protein n=1 Tax=Streptomyces sp. NPDC088124 TaxID=3154654 RepID=UPI003425C337